MDLGQIVDMICDDMQHESDCADELRSQSPIAAAYRDGTADGLRRALVYLELGEANKKAAMPASTAADPLRKETNYLQ